METFITIVLSLSIAIDVIMLGVCLMGMFIAREEKERIQFFFIVTVSALNLIAILN